MLSWSRMEPGTWFTTCEVWMQQILHMYLKWECCELVLPLPLPIAKPHLWYEKCYNTGSETSQEYGKKQNSKVHQQTFSGLFVGRSHGYEDDFLEHWPNRPTADFQESWTVINRIWNVKVQNVNHCEIISFQLEKGMIWICKRLFWMIMCTRTNPARGTLPTHKFAVLNQSWIVMVKTAMVWTWIVTLFAAKNNLLVKINVK